MSTNLFDKSNPKNNILILRVISYVAPLFFVALFLLVFLTKVANTDSMPEYSRIENFKNEEYKGKIVFFKKPQKGIFIAINDIQKGKIMRFYVLGYISSQLKYIQEGDSVYKKPFSTEMELWRYENGYVYYGKISR